MAIHSPVDGVANFVKHMAVRPHLGVQHYLHVGVVNCGGSVEVLFELGERDPPAFDVDVAVVV